MNIENIENNITKKLETFTREQILHFAWICSARLLPYFGYVGNFDFWDVPIRKKYMYTLFSSIDINYAMIDYIRNNQKYNGRKAEKLLALAKNNLADILNAALGTRSKTSDKENNIPFNISNAIFNATNTAISALAFDAPKDSTISVARDAALEALKVRKLIHDVDFNIEMESLIFEDLDNIEKGISIRKNNICLYNEIWNDFQHLLQNEDCSYWGRLYQSIFNDGFTLNLRDLNRRIMLPAEIKSQGATGVANYLEALEKEGGVRLNESRIIIIGDKGAGKTSLARRLLNPNAPMPTENESTEGIDTLIWKPFDLNIHIWDFAGHIVTHATHQFFMSERCVYILVYDSRCEMNNRLEYWLDYIKNYGGNSETIILVNQKDKNRIEINKKSYPQYLIKHVASFSIKDDINELEDFREYLIDYVENNPSWNGLEMPIKYSYVKKELENIFTPEPNKLGREYITRQEFETITSKYDIKEDEILLTNLNALGIILWYKDLAEFNTLVLNPEWISNGVYKIINWAYNNEKYVITLDDFTEIFKNNQQRYPQDKYEYFLNLMIHYELAYVVNQNQLIIPQSLSRNCTLELPLFPEDQCLVLQYIATTSLPADTISRFIVRHNQEIKISEGKQMVWRSGVILEDGLGTIAKIEEINTSIIVSVMGANRTKYIIWLRNTLDDIFSTYKTKKPELCYRVIENHELIKSMNLSSPPLFMTTEQLFKMNQMPVNIQNPIYNIPTTITEYEVFGNIYFYNYNIIRGGKQNAITSLVNDTHIDNKTNIYINANVDLQECLNGIASLLQMHCKSQESLILKTLAENLDKVINYKDEKDLKKSGIRLQVKTILNNLKDSTTALAAAITCLDGGGNLLKNIIDACSRFLSSCQ